MGSSLSVPIEKPIVVGYSKRIPTWACTEKCWIVLFFIQTHLTYSMSFKLFFPLTCNCKLFVLPSQKNDAQPDNLIYPKSKIKAIRPCIWHTILEIWLTVQMHSKEVWSHTVHLSRVIIVDNHCYHYRLMTTFTE